MFFGRRPRPHRASGSFTLAIVTIIYEFVGAAKKRDFAQHHNRVFRGRLSRLRTTTCSCCRGSPATRNRHACSALLACLMAFLFSAPAGAQVHPHHAAQIRKAALQVHVGPPMCAQFKDIYLRRR